MDVVDSQKFILGEPVERLERAVAELSNAAHGIGCANGTDALLIAMRALDIGRGDEVITTPFTFFATAGTIHNVGATPALVDIDPETLNISAAAVKAAITPRTRAVIPVDLFGQLAALEEIVTVAGSIPVIEDAAQSIGARRRIAGKCVMAGEYPTIGTFSFFPSKNLGGYGDGGMIVTQDDALAERLRRLRLHGGAKQYFHDEVGYNSRLDTLQAAVLLAKLPHLAEWSRARAAHARRYGEAFAAHPVICPPKVDPLNEHIFHQYTIRVPRRDELQAALKAKGIGNAVYYPLALHLQPCFAYLGYQRGALPVSEAATSSVISLPIYPELTREQQEAVIDAVLEFYA
jgi:dTDP-4-amino-4,6-dideoxygalactose transaminase